jgi:hypothetical protein
VDAFDGDLLQLDERSYRLSDGDVQQIEMKMDDSLLNGALIGLGVGAGLVALGCAAPGECDSGAAVVSALILGGGLAGLGALFDAAHAGSEVVYVSPQGAPSKRLSVAPLLTRNKKGLLFTIRF